MMVEEESGLGMGNLDLGMDILGLDLGKDSLGLLVEMDAGMEPDDEFEREPEGR
jgi:hypothetical protein